MRTSRARLVGALAAVAAVAGLLAAQSGAVGSGGAADGEGLTAPAKLLEGCKSGRASVGDVFIIPPADAEEVKENGWATSPDEAAQRALGSQALFPSESLGELSLDAGRVVTIPADGDELASEVRVTEYVVSSTEGSALGTITVMPFEFGAYAAVSIQRCAQ